MRSLTNTCEFPLSPLVRQISQILGLRDKSDYSIQGKTLEQIMRESDYYYRQILHRRRINLERRIAREGRDKNTEQPKLKEWSA